jgi:hypothetical protein
MSAPPPPVSAAVGPTPARQHFPARPGGALGQLPSQAGRAGVPAWDGAETGPHRQVQARGPREFALRLRRGAASVWVEVFDPDLRLPRIRTAAETDEGGRGLYLVEQLATRWGSRPTPEGKAVWFEMPRSGGRSLRVSGPGAWPTS